MTLSNHRGHHEGTCTKRRDGRWAAAISIPGGKRKWFYGKTRKAVQDKLREALAAQHEGRLLVGRSQTVNAYLAGWLENVKPSVRPRTYDSYALNVRRLGRHIGEIKLDALRPSHVQECYSQLQGYGLAPRSVRQAHMVLHRALRQAMQWDLVVRNVTEAVNVPRPPHQERPTLSAEQLNQLFAATEGQRWHALWVLLGTRGLRLGEAMGLRWSDINFDTKQLVILRALQRQSAGAGLQFVEPKSATSRRTVALGEMACWALRDHRRRQNEERLSLGSEWHANDLVFCTVFGDPMDPGRIGRYLDRDLRNANCPRIRVHDLRHTAATILLQQNEHPRLVQELLGHSNIALTLGTYSHVAPTMHREAADRMDALFSHR